MDSLTSLSAPKCVLLAIHYCSDSDLTSLRYLASTRSDAINAKLLLRLILTFLPETVEPQRYVGLVAEAVAGTFEGEQSDVALDLSILHGVTDQRARHRVNKSHILELKHELYGDFDDLTNFLINRAHRIDTETGLPCPELITPFIDTSEPLRSWFISYYLPLLRTQFEYYPSSTPSYSLDGFVSATDNEALGFLLAQSLPSDAKLLAERRLERDIQNLVGPWINGGAELRRRRRKETQAARRRGSSTVNGNRHNSSDKVLSPVEEDWNRLFQWLAQHSMDPATFLPIIAAIEEWDGPGDVDYGGYDGPETVLNEAIQGKIEKRYAQAAFACAYSVQSADPKVIEAVHVLLVRLAQLCDYEPPPDLATSVNQLPDIISQISPSLDETSPSVLNPEVLLRDGHPLTNATEETFSLLQIFLFSAYTLASLWNPTSIVDIAKLRFQTEESEKSAVLQRILHTAVDRLKLDEQQWYMLRKKLFWLWSWGMDDNDTLGLRGPGIFGQIERNVFEKEILKAMLNATMYNVVIETYVKSTPTTRLIASEIEESILEVALQLYDSASNGNRLRGNMKKCSDLLVAMRPHYSASLGFRRIEKLIAATHALSFYSLTLQRGVVFQPVAIRVRDDALTLIELVLEQNPRSYTKVDDLITIGQNLVAAGLPTQDSPPMDPSEIDLTAQQALAERRVLGMAIKAALSEDDFETAYSYVINRLNPSATTTTTTTPSSKPLSSSQPSDDLSWRAAFLAGRHESSPLSSSYPSQSSLDPTSPTLRRLEQRLDLLSLALLLAPTASLSDILTVWQECEAEMNVLLAREAQAEQSFNDHADRRLPGEFVSAAPIQPRREVGRGAVEEAPMGLFDVARGAAAAFGRSAGAFAGQGADKGGDGSGDGGQRGQQRAESRASETGSLGAGSEVGIEGERVRKRDQLASAVTGGLASGLGWVLGATPNTQVERH